MPTSTTEKLIEALRKEFPIIMGAAFGFEEKIRHAFEEVRASEREEIKGVLEGMKKRAIKDDEQLDGHPANDIDKAHCVGRRYALDEAIAKL